MSIRDDYQEYKQALNDLKMNSKPVINFLTLLAEEKLANAAQVVRAIEERILETKGDAVLPVLYVLDSIVKNLRSSVYTQSFEPKLPVLFAGAFNKVDEKTRLAMFKLRQTWTPYFSNAALHNLDTRTNYIDPAWPITARLPEVAVASSTNIHVNPNFIQRPPPTTTVETSKPEENDRTVNKSRDDNYHMIPIDRARLMDIDHSVEKTPENESQPKSKGINERRDPRPAPTPTNEEKKDQVEKESKTKTPVAENTENEVDNLFGGSDIDYRDTADVAPQSKSTGNNTVDSDRIFELNNKCFSLAEEKYKSKELSTEEYQATLKFLQNILQTEAQRLTAAPTAPSTFINAASHSAPIGQATPFSSQTFLTFATAPSTTSTGSAAPATTAFPMTTDFANDTQRHAMQILATVGASFQYPSAFNLLPFLPPLPPAPPSFTLVSNSFPSAATGPSTSSATGTNQVLLSGRPSPTIKRRRDENNIESNSTEDETKRKRNDHTNIPNFDEENIAAVPSLIEANVNALKKRYQGVIQQLYIGKNQCRSCGLRFTGKQKQAYTAHLDWHFRENQQASAASAHLQTCRDWYPSLQEWTVYEGNQDEENSSHSSMSKQNRHSKSSDPKYHYLSSHSFSSSEMISCPAKNNGEPDDDRCYVCHDPFETFFDDNREEWHLKDAIRVDGKTYHPICYQDVQFQSINDKEMLDPTISGDSSLSMDLRNETTNGDSQLMENAMATAKIKSDHDDSGDDEHSSSSESHKPAYLSSMSFVNLIETIFVKKEDLKPIENLDSNSNSNIKDELIDPTSMSEEIPFLSIKRETECEF